MCSGHHPERTVATLAIVEMDPHGNHLGEHLGWRFYVNRAGLRPPTGVSSDIAPLFDCNGAVLMPLHAPIGFEGLVEQRGLHGYEVAPHYGPQIFTQALVTEQSVDRGVKNEIANAGRPNDQRKRGDEMVALL